MTLSAGLQRRTARAGAACFHAAKRARWAVRPTRALEDKTVVFVAGVQRSGTNMITDVLRRSRETDVFHETDPRAFEAYEMRPLPVIRELVETSPARVVVFKCLCELQDLKALLDAFPNARAVWNLRRYDDMINSHAKAQFAAGRQRLCPGRINDLAGDAGAAGWRGRGMTAETQAVLRRLARPDIDHESAVGLFWYLRNQLYFDQGLQADPRVRVLGYEAFVTAPRAMGTALFDWLDLPPSAYAVRAVTARSIGRWRQPEIDAQVRALCESLRARFDAEAPAIRQAPDAQTPEAGDDAVQPVLKRAG